MTNIQIEENHPDIRNETALRTYIADEPCKLKRASYSLELAWLVREKNQVESEKLAMNALKLSSDLDASHATLVAKANVILSFLNFRRSDYERAIRLASDAILILDQGTMLHWQARAFGNIGICQKETGNKLEAIENLQTAVDLAHSGGDSCKVELAYAMHDLALCQQEMPLMRAALAIATELNDRVTMALASANLGSWQVRNKDLEEAGKLLQLAEDITQADQLWSVLSFVFTAQGEYYCALGEDARALEKFDAALALSQTREDPYLIALSLASYATCLQKHGKHEEALALLKEAIKSSVEANHKPLLISFYRMQADSYEQIGEMGKALASSRLAIRQQDKLHEEQRDKQRAILKAAHEAEKMRLEAHLERKRNQELEGLVAERTEALTSSLARENTLTRELERALIVEAEVSALKSQIINNISHEFRTPLTIIHNASDILHNYRARLSEEKQEAHYRRIKDAIKNLTESLSDVIAVGDTTSATIRPKPTSAPFSEIVDRIVSHPECHHIPDNHITVQQNGESDLVLLVDIELVARAVGQLVGNSLKFCDDSSTIAVSFDVEADELIIIVSDDGIGVPEGEADKVFELFYRGSNVDTRRGIGLGLYNLNKSVRTLKGSVELKSGGVNQGCLVRVSIPAGLLSKEASTQLEALAAA